jgi:hypothetical protein
VPKALVIDDDMPRRRASSRSIEPEITQERGFLLRLLLRNPKDVVAGFVATVAAVAIIGNAMFMQAGRHPAPMFSAVFPVTPAPSAPSQPAQPQANVPTSAQPQANVPVSPLPRPRPTEAELRPDARTTETASAPVVHTPPQASTAALRPPAPIPSHADPVGDLIISTRRITAVQRALTEYGYAQLKPTGVVGPETRAAIERFERERKLPVTGQISDRLVRELSAITGRAID